MFTKIHKNTHTHTNKCKNTQTHTCTPLASAAFPPKTAPPKTRGRVSAGKCLASYTAALHVHIEVPLAAVAAGGLTSQGCCLLLTCVPLLPPAPAAPAAVAAAAAAAAAAARRHP